jgi:choline dehydrogenase-like flavoprotein
MPVAPLRNLQILAARGKLPILWICDGSVFPTVGGVNPSLTIQAVACRTADRIKTLAARANWTLCSKLALDEVPAARAG